jgi:uncharacterized protein YjbK
MEDVDMTIQVMANMQAARELNRRWEQQEGLLETSEELYLSVEEYDAEMEAEAAAQANEDERWK